MGERMLRGSRLGAVSYESDRNTELAPRQTREYLCARGHQFEVPFAVDAEVPMTWECKFDGTVARLAQGPGTGPALVFNNIRDYGANSRCRRVFTGGPRSVGWPRWGGHGTARWDLAQGIPHYRPNLAARLVAYGDLPVRRYHGAGRDGRVS